MRRWKLAAGAAASSVLLAAGIFAAFTLTARATTQATCPTASASANQSTELTCSIGDQTINAPAAITLTITTDPGGIEVDVTWETICSDPAGDLGTDYSPANLTVTTPTGTGSESATTDMSLSVDDATSCDATASATVDSSVSVSSVSSLGMEMDYTEQPSAATTSASPTPSASTSTASTTTYYNNQVHGFDGTCLDDKGNSSSKRAEVIIWGCNDTDQAQGWTYSGSELKIHGMCLNAKGNGKTGSKLILWSCTGSGNEIFSHNSHDEFVEKANGWSLCIDDPSYSTKNGTQPFMYKCNNGANQHWSKP